MKINYPLFLLVFVGLFQGNFLNAKEVIAAPTKGIMSIETGYTITKVRTAISNKKSFIVASSYEGTVMGISYDGKVLFKNALSGFMNHDIWCQDLNADGKDEILIANADGNIYCLNSDGKLQWQFKKDDTPMYAVCAIKKENQTYVVCSGFDKSIYYLNAAGKQIKELKSSSYSQEKNFGKMDGTPPPNGVHTANFIRAIPQTDGTEVLAIIGTNNNMSASGSMYLFKALEDLPFRKDKVSISKPIGDFRVIDRKDDGKKEVLLGNSVHTKDAVFGIYSPETGKIKSAKITGIPSGYTVVQGEKIGTGKNAQYFILTADRILLLNLDLDMKKIETLVSKNSFNDMWKDPTNGKIILASSQSGGSCIHIINTEDPNWKSEYVKLNPPGNIETILKNRVILGEQVKKFQPLAWERKPVPVYFMSESFKTPIAKSVSDTIKANYESPIFLNSISSNQVQSAESWKRDTISNASYRDKRDKRKQYILTQEQVLANFSEGYKNGPGLATWGGHGNDPYFYAPETLRKTIDIAAGKKTVLIYPEMEDHSKNFEYAMNNLIYPLAKYSQGKNTNLFIRSKNIYWMGTAYEPEWRRLLSGEFADVFIPSMEETSDKVMELSITGRLGMWVSGATNSWGARAVRDNTSFDRQRQFSFQTIPNHYLRMLTYHLSYGTTYLDNFPIDQDYMSVLWDMVAKGIIYVPKSNEILSFSPVHLGMITPDEHFLQEGSSVKFTTYFDKEYEAKNPAVFSRMNGSWIGAQVTPWDFSRYAAGVTERRLNFLAPYKNGMVLVVPPQNGAFAKSDQPRGKMTDHLHPFYKNILKEYITDGKDYFSSDGKQKMAANEYYKVVEKDIQDSAKLLPVTVSGDVAWVVAQTAPKHLRVTLIDSGYINPKERLANLTFNGIKPVKITDILSGEKWEVTTPLSFQIKVALGSFRFLDVELESAF